MAKFKIGDRVRVIDPQEVEYGKVGTVIEVSNNPWVAFDKPTEYGGGRDYYQQGWVNGHMDCMWQDKLELFVGTVQSAIDAYNAACQAYEAAELAVEKAKQDVADARLNLRDALERET